MRKKGLELKPEYDDLFFGSYKSQIKKYNYQKILKNWFSVFDKSQILVLSMEDIKNKPHEVIEKTCHFLGKPYVESTLDLSKAKNTTRLMYYSIIARKNIDLLKYFIQVMIKYFLKAI